MYKINNNPIRMNFSRGAHNKIYWKCLHVICSCFDAMALSEKDSKTRWGMLGFIKCFAILIPNKTWSVWMQDFIKMTDKTRMEVLSNDKLKVYYSMNDPDILENYIIDSKTTNALEWSWALHEYINYKRRLNGEQILSMSFTDLQEKYNPKYVTKDFWEDLPGLCYILSLYIWIHLMTLQRRFGRPLFQVFSLFFLVLYVGLM